MDRDHDKTKVGYEIPFNRHFYVFKPPRPLAEIDAALKGVTDRILSYLFRAYDDTKVFFHGRWPSAINEV